MVMRVMNSAGESVELSKEPLAQGGEGTVYAVPRVPRAVVKIYHPEVLQKRKAALQDKVTAMTEPQLASIAQQAAQHADLAWPFFSVFDEKNQWLGYAMRKVNGARFNVMAHACAYQAVFKSLDRRGVLDVLIAMTDTVARLHERNVLMGDYNLSNFLVDPKTLRLSFIDCDAWQVQSPSKTFYCPVAAPDMLPPELHDKQLSKVRRTPQMEAFSLAIVIFKALMLGRHPYDMRGGEDPVANIRRGHFPYGTGGGGIPVGPWYNIWSHLPYRLKEALIRSFREGAVDPNVRLSAKAWHELLSLYRKEIDLGYHIADLKPTTPKSKDYRGQAVMAAVG